MTVAINDGRGSISLAGGSAAVASVNGSTGAVAVDWNSALTHGSTYTAAVQDGNTVTVTRTVDNPAGTDIWQFVVAGARAGYFNEAGLPRARAPQGQVAGRWQCNVLDNGTSQHIGEFTLSDNTPMLWGAADGSGGVATGPFSIGGSNATKASDWAAFANIDSQSGGSLGVNVSQGTPTLQSRNAPGGFTELQGQLSIGGSISANTTLATLPTGQRPARAEQFTLRFLGTGAAGTVVNIDTSGNISIPNALVTGNSFSMSGMRFQHS